MQIEISFRYRNRTVFYLAHALVKTLLCCHQFFICMAVLMNYITCHLNNIAGTLHVTFFPNNSALQKTCSIAKTSSLFCFFFSLFRVLLLS